MTKITKEKLEEMREQMENGTYVASDLPSTVLALVDLVERQHEMLTYCKQDLEALGVKLDGSKLVQLIEEVEGT